MESELDELDRQIEDLEHQAATATGDARRELDEALAALKARREQIDLKIDRPLYSEDERKLMLEAEEARSQIRDDL